MPVVNELKPCPFCGGSLVVRFDGWFDHPKSKCILAGKAFTKGYIGQWNVRADDAALSEAIARAERAEATSKKLAESNLAISARLAHPDPKYSGHITHVFGMPMDEVLDIINAAKEAT